MTRTWILRAGVVLWLGGGAAALLVVSDAPAGPAIAERLYRDARSMRSSAPAGTLAFARTLETLGFTTAVNRRAGAPDADALFVLGPRVELAGDEVEALLGWVSRGGRLAYGPEADPMVDALAEKVRARGTRALTSGVAELWDVGIGRVAILYDHGDVLTNRNLRASGLGPELPWLRPLLAGANRVAFDEARLGVTRSEDIVDVALRSRFGPALAVALLALFSWLWATGLRTQPCTAVARSDTRDFGEYLEVLALALAEKGRVALAHDLLVEGATRRLGKDASRPEVAAALAGAREKPDGPAALVERARALARLELELRGPASMRSTPSPGPELTIPERQESRVSCL